MMNYLSALKAVLVENIYSGQEGIFSELGWYSKVRQTLTKKFKKRSQEYGIPLVNLPDDLTESILTDISETLFAKSSQKGDEDRAMIILLWQLLGRINKISFLRLSKLSMQEQTGAINVSLLRSKGGK